MKDVLTKELEEYVDSQVKAGGYESPSDVVCEALENQYHQVMQKKLDDRLEQGHQQFLNGETVPGDDVFYESKKEMIRKKYMNKN
jgi:Arc/MetJ-type ribon-helix-helix transcriptional regulator